MDRAGVRVDLEAGAIGAIVVLPQAIAFAAIAGVPPVYGIYTSIVPVIVAALWGSSWHVVSGPNAGVSVLIGLSIAPLAVAGGPEYIGLVLILSLMVGVSQFLIGLFRLGGVLDFISNTVISGIVMAIAFVLLLSATRSVLEISAAPGGTTVTQFLHILQSLPEANWQSLTVGLATVGGGAVVRRWSKKYSLMAGILSGAAMAAVMGLVMGQENLSMAMIGAFDIQLIALTVPWASLADGIPWMALAPGVMSITLLGMVLTVVISRSIAKKTGQAIDTNKEIVAQGLANIAASFLSGFAGSGTLNRSAVNYEAGARTPLSTIMSSLLLLGMMLLAVDLVAAIPAAAIGGTLFFVGYGLMDFRAARSFFRSRSETVVYFAVLAVAMTVGLNAAIGTGILISLTVYLWHASKPNVRIAEHYSRDGRLVTVVTLDGNLFFGAVQYVERALAAAGQGDEPGIFLIRTDHMTYMDVPGGQLIAEEAKRRRDRGDTVYVYITRDELLHTLDRAGALDVLGGDGIIHRDRDHPAKELLNPYRPPAPAVHVARAEADMPALAAELRGIRMFGPVPADVLLAMLEKAGVQAAMAGDAVLSRQETADSHLVLISGAIEVRRSWTTLDGIEKNSARVVEAGAGAGPVAVIGASPRGMELWAVGDSRYLTLDAGAIDEIVGRRLASSSEAVAEGLGSSGIMRQLPPEQLQKVMESMVPVEIDAGEPVVRQGDPGEEYFLIEEGDAEVWREDAFTQQSACLATLGPGDAFGEEALLQGGYRNATVRMVTHGRLLKLSKGDFDRLVKEPLAPEIAAAEAKALLDEGKAVLLDCRYDMEIGENRITGARSLPLDQIRSLSHQIDLGSRYLVYCRNGQRSRVAAFLLKERGIDAVSIAGGISAWPYEIDLSPVEDIAALGV